MKTLLNKKVSWIKIDAKAFAGVTAVSILVATLVHLIAERKPTENQVHRRWQILSEQEKKKAVCDKMHSIVHRQQAKRFASWKEKTRLAKRENDKATLIQKVFRGFIARKAFKKAQASKPPIEQVNIPKEIDLTQSSVFNFQQ